MEQIGLAAAGRTDDKPMRGELLRREGNEGFTQ
jgi:hypothetical protein